MVCGIGLAAGPAAVREPPTVARVDPPSWWAGHTINPVRLLVRGTNLKDAFVRAERPGVEPGDVTASERGTALFVTLKIDPKAAPGSYPLRIENAGGTATIAFEIAAPLGPGAGFRGIDEDDILYLIMPDRFRDGDPANDAPADAPPEANDRRQGRAWHGGDFRGIIDRLPYLKDLGVTAIWLTPWYDNANGLTLCDKPWCPYTGYHGYYPVDHYAVEDRFGDLKTLRELVAQAHASGIKVVQDQIANHVGPRHPWLIDPPSPTWLHGTTAKHRDNAFRVDLLVSPHASPADRAPTLDGWFAGELPDLNQDDPEAARYLIQNAVWWAGATGIDGVRLDTTPYVPRPFLRDLTSALHRQHPRLTIVGEVLELDPAHTSFYLGGRAGWDGVDTGLDSVFDFPTWAASVNGFAGKQPLKALRAVLKADALYADARRLTVPTGNHDLPRAPSFPGMTPEGARLHLAFVLSTRGTPQLYAGDEIGMPGGDDPDNRRDFPGGFPGDPRSAFDPDGRTPAERVAFDWARAWISLRRTHSALRRGALIDLAADDDTYAFARRDARETILVAFNRASVPRTITFPRASLGAGARLVPRIGPGPALPIGGESISLTLPPRSASAFAVEP
jgi:glycosidase